MPLNVRFDRALERTQVPTSLRSTRRPSVTAFSCAAVWAAVSSIAHAAADPDWPMLAHDPARSGATAAEPRPPFARQWYRLFPDEGLMAGVQPVVAGGKVFIGTLRGVLHAIEAESGQDVWSYRAGGAILHAVAVAEGKVFFGAADGKLYALEAATGETAWDFPTGAAVWNAPLAHAGRVVFGSRDGTLYALEAASGRRLWSAALGAPILQSAALDARSGRVYAGGEDLRVHAFALDDGRRLWTSAQLPGVSLRGYHPVIAPDGSVLVAVQPGVALERFEDLAMEAVKEVFGDFASWRHKEDENRRLRRESFALLEKPDTHARQLEAIRRRLAGRPELQTFFVLDPENGRQRFVAPIVYAESMNGPGAPAVVAADGRVIVKYQALLRCRYEHYSPFLQVGALDTASGFIAPLMDQDRTYGWHDSLLLVHDEQCQLSAGGRVLFNAHQDNVNALDLETRQGWTQPLCRGIHEPAQGEALGIWARIWRGEELPAGKEWLARGTAVYGGGSAIDTAAVIAGDSFYYLPTHEISAGAALIAYRSQADGKASESAPPPRADLSEAERRSVQDLPWDWDALGTPRLRHVLESLPEKVPGTRERPLSVEAREQAARIPDIELERLVWEERVAVSLPAERWAPLRRRLEAAVAELIERPWRPLVFPAGKHPSEAYLIFADPSETLLAMALAYPFLGEPLRTRVREHGDALIAGADPAAGLFERRTHDARRGEPRPAHAEPPADLLRLAVPEVRSSLERLHPLWLWWRRTGGWDGLAAAWPRLRGLVNEPAGKLETDCGNARAAGLIAHCRLARRQGDAAALEEGLAAARRALRERLEYELAHPRGGVLLPVPVQRTAFSRWHRLTPEVGRLCATQAGTMQRRLMDVYVDHHRPVWHLAWGVETMVRNECPLELPTSALAIFQARAWILGEPAAKLEGFIDLPWCKADEFHIERLALVLEAACESVWRAVE